MSFQQLYKRPDGSRVKVEPVLEIDRFDNEAFQRSYIVCHAPPGQKKLKDVTTEHLEGQAYATEQEIQECQLLLWEMLRPEIDQQ